MGGTRLSSECDLGYRYDTVNDVDDDVVVCGGGWWGELASSLTFVAVLIRLDRLLLWTMDST
jgi:hypothetical protein